MTVFFATDLSLADGKEISPQSFPDSCPQVSVEDLVNRHSGGRPLTLKFFASWCGSCKDDMESMRTQPPRDDLILLSTFDDEKSALATLKHFDVRQRCLGGDAVARKLGVRHLPRSFRLENGKFAEIKAGPGKGTM
jgi:hypothetical protein